MEKNLNKEFRETMDEAKEMLAMGAMRASVSTEDTEDIMTNIKLLRLLNRMADLCCDMFEKQDRLMDKLDKVADKYLEK